MQLAHTNRVVTMGELSASITISRVGGVVALIALGFPVARTDCREV
jgi:hypothetical protein